jgi:hypothetical protein
MKRLFLALAVLFAFVAPASAWWTKGWVPPCDSHEVIAKIKEKFAYAERNTFHWGVNIEKVTAIYESPQVIRMPKSWINRRYCSGTAWMSDGTRSKVVFLIESRQGFASIGYKVESCLPGYDPWNTYDGYCRSIQP